MPERIVTDSTGDRWDVSDASGAGGADGGETTINFRHQSGLELSGAADRSVDQMSDEEIRALLDDAREEADLEALPEDGDDRGADPDDYIT